jgi:3-hydroxyisobutyrate dehydrogenase
MGAGMAARLQQASYPLSVYNPHPERAAGLVDKGAILASSPRGAAQNADVIIAMVPDDAASRDAWTGPNGALQGAKPGAIAIDCSTLTPAWVRELAAAAISHGCEFLDAPVTGSRPQAAAGELLFLVGGDEAVLDRVRPILKHMSRDITHLGPTGSGALMKLINNFVCGVQAAVLGEAMGVIEKSGLDREKAVAILANGAPGSPLVKGVSARMIAATYEIFFKLRLMQKDLTYAAEEAGKHGVELATVNAALEHFAKARELGWGDRDMSAVVEAIRGGRA